MTAELVRGQNHPLSQVRLEIRISAGVPVLAGATLGDEHGTVHGAPWVVHPGAPTLPGIEVSGQAATDHRLAVDLAALPEAVHRVSVLLALPERPGGPLRFGAFAAPTTVVTGLDGTGIVRFTLTGLDAESAVVALELYRRQGAWKVRAVGQGYAGGLTALLADQGLPQPGDLAAQIQEAVTRSLARAIPAPPPQHVPDAATPAPMPSYDSPDAHDVPASGGPVDYTHSHRRTHTAPPPPPPTAGPAPDDQPAQPVAGDAVGWSMEERLYNQVWGMFEDLARTTAAYRSAVDFADSRLEKELDQVLSDPRSRLGTAGDVAREAAHARHSQLVDQARAALDRDLAQLTAESEVVEPALPLAYARWDNPVWHGYRAPAEPPLALRLGDLHLPESVSLRIPLLVRLPLERGLWIDSGPVAGPDDTIPDPAELRRLAMEAAVALAARLLAVHPAGEFAVQVIDPAGAGAQALQPLTRAGALVAPPATGAAGVTDVLGRLTRHVDLMQMAIRGGAAESLPPDIDTAQQLLIVNDFPHGFDDRAVTQLRYLADEGPAVGVHLVMVADREDAEAYGPLLDPLWRSLMRLTPVPDDHLADPWVGHAWTYEPSLVPPGSSILQQVLAEVTAARTKRR
ncbi:export associated protein [Streptomyces cellostaticus]|uniref:Export associated protein n=1 Tax=Streptomyces cellostaticus TaxID=67285 RepID=A0A101NRX5_9ACTN|nr:TerD family protein [Streptomyces cellostaticus]KUM98274.1 export associated protein [Streptomyces cellostaticus]GHI08542.1 export associated protein [Streptomyces cellostaticus]